MSENKGPSNEHSHQGWLNYLMGFGE